MAGRRRRRQSDSTVATVDELALRPKKESALLKPVSKDTDDDEWPCFVLKDAVIYQKDGVRIANPLLVDIEGPFIVRGHLDIDEEDLEPLLVKPKVKSAYIEIPSSKRYSIGYGPVTLWVSGDAGWFEITPSPAYAAMYCEIQEAITLYYEIMMAYEQQDPAAKKKKKSKKDRSLPAPTLDQVFLQYAINVGDGVFRHEVEARCDKWAEFFIAQFPKETQYRWSDTYFSRWIQDRNPDAKQRLADAAAGLLRRLPTISPVPEPRRSKSRSAKPAARPSMDPEDVAMVDTSSASPPAGKEKGKAKARASREASGSAPVRTGGRATDAAADKAVLDGLLEVLGEIRLDTDNDKKLSERRVRSRMYFMCRVPNYERPIQMVTYYARDLLLRLGPQWKPTTFYTWLIAVSKEPLPVFEQEVINEFRINVTRRGARAMGPPAAPPKTTARPAAANQDTPNEEYSESGSVGTGKHPQAGRTAGKMSALRPKKRPASALEESPSSGRRRRMSAKPSGSGSDDSAGSSDETASDESTHSDTASGRSFPVRLLVRAEAIPSTTPTGPNGTWVCREPGCGFVVRAAREEGGKELIEQHFKEHENQARMMNLAREESQSHGHLPIDHLLQKIQELNKANPKRPAQEINGQRVPSPIKRRLLV